MPFEKKSANDGDDKGKDGKRAFDKFAALRQAARKVKPAEKKASSPKQDEAKCKAAEAFGKGRK
jgi:hypothetical protein